MKLTAWILDLLYPEKCLLCARVLEKEEMDLCHSCRCQVSDHPICKEKLPFLDSWIALWYYEGNVRESLLRYKFRGRRCYAAGYGRLLAMKLLSQERADYDLVTWIPISPRRLRRRGFDQVELIARELGKQLQLPVAPTMKKVRHNKQQSRIAGHAQRKANVLGAYKILENAPIAGKRILLLDDIITTGATAGEAARVLLTDGAAEVHLAVIANAKHENKSGR